MTVTNVNKYSISFFYYNLSCIMLIIFINILSVLIKKLNRIIINFPKKDAMKYIYIYMYIL